MTTTPAEGPITTAFVSRALSADGCERLREWAAIGPVQRAEVENFADHVIRVHSAYAPAPATPDLGALPEPALTVVHNPNTHERQVSTHGVAYYGSNWRAEHRCYTAAQMHSERERTYRLGLAAGQAAQVAPVGLTPKSWQELAASWLRYKADAAEPEAKKTGWANPIHLYPGTLRMLADELESDAAQAPFGLEPWEADSAPAPVGLTDARWRETGEDDPQDGQQVLAVIRPYNNPDNAWMIVHAVYMDAQWLGATDGDELHPPHYWMPAPALPDAGPDIPAPRSEGGE